MNSSRPSTAVVEYVAGFVAEDPLHRDHDVYLCYASPDLDLARQLHIELVTHDRDVWFDRMNLDLGVSQTRQMDRGIARSRVGALLVTPAFLEGRRWTEREWTALLGADKRVIPIVAGPRSGPSPPTAPCSPIWLAQPRRHGCRRRRRCDSRGLSSRAIGGAGVDPPASGAEDRRRVEHQVHRGADGHVDEQAHPVGAISGDVVPLSGRSRTEVT